MPSDRTPQMCPVCGNTVNIRDYEYFGWPMVMCDGTEEHEGCDFATNAEAWNKLSRMRRERDALRRQYDPHGSY